MAKRSEDFWIIAFFLSKYGNTVQGQDTTPPIELNTLKWKEAYEFFYDRFGNGRTIRSFENSMKNCRDTYDSHIRNSSRNGWRTRDGKPVNLAPLPKRVFNVYNSMGREVVWHKIQNLVTNPEFSISPAIVIKKSDKRQDVIINQSIKNPNWTREELILALDLYFDLDQGQMHKGHPDVIRISNELRELKIHHEIPDPGKFRNPSGISRRLGNFKTMDSGYVGQGLANSGKLAKEIFEEFTNHRDKLRKEAELVRQLYLKPKREKQTVAAEKKVDYKSELLFLFHKNRETDPLVIKVKKEMVLSNSKSLKCEVCGFDSVSFYGEIGNDLMEIHYNKELRTQPGLESSSMEDFIIVCSNCHKALDKNFFLINSDDLKKIILKC